MTFVVTSNVQLRITEQEINTVNVVETCFETNDASSTNAVQMILLIDGASVTQNMSQMSCPHNVWQDSSQTICDYSGNEENYAFINGVYKKRNGQSDVHTFWNYVTLNPSYTGSNATHSYVFFGMANALDTSIPANNVPTNSCVYISLDQKPSDITVPYSNEVIVAPDSVATTVMSVPPYVVSLSPSSPPSMPPSTPSTTIIRQEINIPANTLTSISLYVNTTLDLDSLTGVSWTQNDYFNSINRNTFYQTSSSAWQGNKILHPGEGYWVVVANGFDLNITGTPYLPSGFNIPANQLTSIGLSYNIALDLQTISGVNWSQNDYFNSINKNTFYQTSTSAWQGDSILQSGEGYWGVVANGISYVYN